MTEVGAEIEELLRARLAAVAAGPDGAPFESRVTAEAEEVLLGFWRQGLLAGRARGEAFSVRCEPGPGAGSVVLVAGFTPIETSEAEVVRIEAGPPGPPRS